MARLSWGDQFALVFVAVGAPVERPELADALLAAISPYVQSPLRIRSAFVPVRVIRQAGGVTSGEDVEIVSGEYLVVDGPFDGRTAEPTARVVTSVKLLARLRIPAGATRDTVLGELRASLRSGLFPALRTSGASVIQWTVQPVSQPIANDPLVPPTPTVPIDIGALFGYVAGAVAVGGAIWLSRQQER